MPSLYYAGNAGVPQPAIYLLRLDNSDWLQGAFYAALGSLGEPENWTQTGDITVEDAASQGAKILYDCNLAVDMIGMIMPFAGVLSNVPIGTFPCDGRTLNTLEYPKLAAIMGAFYPDDPTFTVPDLRGRFMVGLNESSNWTYNPARAVYTAQSTGGNETKPIAITNLPAHSHTSPAHSHTDTGHTHAEGVAAPTAILVGVGAPVPSAIPAASITGIGAANLTPTAVTIDNTGGDTPLDVRPPYYALAYVIIAEWAGR